jgi:cyclophilin family peptidyl-prolyl cis-trans isomerase/HEAT repeat protein
MKKLLSVLLAFIFLPASLAAQISVRTLVEIVKAEDELRFDKTLEDLMKSPDAKIRTRAALASGRIGNEAAIPILINLLENDKDTNVNAMAAFALGEIESIKSADAILAIFKNTYNNGTLRARAIEAAGKIVAANAKDDKAKLLGEAILQTLTFEHRKRSSPNLKFVEFGLTAVLRARPAEAEKTVIFFISAYTPQIRANALNTLARLRAKNANEIARELLRTDTDAIVRANAARVLGAAEDKDALEILLTAATKDKDSRVRVSAIRALASLKDASVADKLLNYSDMLLEIYKKAQKPNFTPVEKNEILETATALSRILPNTDNEKAIKILVEFMKLDEFQSPEIMIALARITPKNFRDLTFIPQDFNYKRGTNWQAAISLIQGINEFANLGENEELKPFRDKVLKDFFDTVKNPRQHFGEKNYAQTFSRVFPEVLRVYANFKTDDLNEVLHRNLKEKDLFVRAVAAELLGEQSANKESIKALKIAFAESLKTDKDYNDAQLAILSALVKLDKAAAVSSLNLALDASDFLIRRQAVQLIKQNDLTKDFPNYEAKAATLKPYDAKTGTRLGQILNTTADYTRAVSRKNGTVKAIFQTEKGNFTIDLMPEDAPLTVDNFIKLAKSNYFNGVAVHRVVPNFVMQDGDPRGDGNGGPGYSIRCELNMLEYSRGAVGMALSGKDTGGSQWFVTHSPQPHLDGGYTVFGRVNENDMKTVDAIVRGDKILSVRIVESAKVKTNK